MAALTYTNLISRVCDRVATHVSRRDVDEIVHSTLETVAEALARGEKVTLAGFGVFEVKHQPERVGHNPQTGDPLVIPARNAVRFRSLTGLKRAVNREEANA